MAFNKVLLLAFTLLLLTVTIAHDDFDCDHDNQDFDTQELEVEEDLSNFATEASDDQEDEGRSLGSSSYPKMRIKPHYTFLNSAPTSFRAYIKNELAPPVIAYFSNALHLKAPLTTALKISSSIKEICQKSVPSELRTGVNTDYFVIFDHRSEDTSTVATSKACYRAAGTKRPLVGYTNFNRNMFKPSNGDVLANEKNMYLLLHEMMHALGISKDAYPMYIDSTGKTRTGHIKTKSFAGTTQTYLSIPSLTTRLRRFYGCSTLPGLILENNGGSGTAGSHFERKHFPYEVMSSGSVHGRRISEFSLALLEGSGWYVPNYSYAEPYFYGQGQGCNFINQQCSASKTYFDEFCTGSARGCAPQGRSGGKCTSDSKSNGCRWMNPMPEYDCENVDAVDYARFPAAESYGRTANSKCFSGTLSSRSSTSQTSFCFKYTCVGSGSSTSLQVQVGNKTVTCSRKGNMSVTGYYGFINCPDPVEFCQTVGKKYCPRGCMGRGSCVNNKCVCNRGFKGVDCGLYI